MIFNFPSISKKLFSFFHFVFSEIRMMEAIQVYPVLISKIPRKMTVDQVHSNAFSGVKMEHKEKVTVMRENYKQMKAHLASMGLSSVDEAKQSAMAPKLINVSICLGSYPG